MARPRPRPGVGSQVGQASSNVVNLDVAEMEVAGDAHVEAASDLHRSIATPCFALRVVLGVLIPTGRRPSSPIRCVISGGCDVQIPGRIDQ